MRRFVIFSTIILSLLISPSNNVVTQSNMNTPVELASYVAATTVNPGPCSDPDFEVQPSMGGEKVRRRMVALIRCATDKWSVPGGLAKALDVAYCESGANLWPWAGYMGSLGVFQQNGKYWQGRVNTYLKPSWFPGQWKRIHNVPEGAYNARANVLVSIRMAHAGGWGPWSCA